MSRGNVGERRDDGRKRGAPSPLTRARVLEAAVDLADREGIDAVSMRRLGQELGIEAMSLYTHVRGKDDLLDGMVDAVVARDHRSTRQVPTGGRRSGGRSSAPGRSCFATRWAARVIETRTTPGLATLALHGSDDRGHPRWRLHGRPRPTTRCTSSGSRVLGFNQDLYDDSGAPDEAAAAFAAQLAAPTRTSRAIAGAASHEGGLGGCDDDYEFAFGLDLILDGLAAAVGARAKGAERGSRESSPTAMAKPEHGDDG